MGSEGLGEVRKGAKKLGIKGCATTLWILGAFRVGCEEGVWYG